MTNTNMPTTGFHTNPDRINRKGRPLKGYSITEAFQSMLSAEPKVKAEIVQSIKEKALKGDPTAQKLIWNYMDGMPPQAPDSPGSSAERPLFIVKKMT